MKIRQSHDHMKFTMENHMHRKTAYKCIETGPRLLWFNIIVDNELYYKPEDIFFFFLKGKYYAISKLRYSSMIHHNQPNVQNRLTVFSDSSRLLTGYYLSGKKKKKKWMTSFSIAFQLYNNNDDIIFNTQVILLPVLTKWLLQNHFALSTAAELSWRAKLCCDQMADNFITAS